MIEFGIGLGGIIAAFRLAYDLSKKKSEPERIKDGLIVSLKKFKFFYEDMGWSHIRNTGSYKMQMSSMAEEFRILAAQIDGKIDSQITNNLRGIARNLSAAASETPEINTGGFSSGQRLEKSSEHSHSLTDQTLSLLTKK